MFSLKLAADWSADWPAFFTDTDILFQRVCCIEYRRNTCTESSLHSQGLTDLSKF